jgi:hypothetical protein
MLAPTWVGKVFQCSNFARRNRVNPRKAGAWWRRSCERECPCVGSDVFGIRGLLSHAHIKEPPTSSSRPEDSHLRSFSHRSVSGAVHRRGIARLSRRGSALSSEMGASILTTSQIVIVSANAVSNRMSSPPFEPVPPVGKESPGKLKSYIPLSISTVHLRDLFRANRETTQQPSGNLDVK